MHLKLQAKKNECYEKVSFICLALFLTFGSCSMDKLNDAGIIEYFEEWDITIPYQDVSKSKTYKLLDAFDANFFIPISFIKFFSASDLTVFLNCF